MSRNRRVQASVYPAPFAGLFAVALPAYKFSELALEFVRWIDVLLGLALDTLALAHTNTHTHTRKYTYVTHTLRSRMQKPMSACLHQFNNNNCTFEEGNCWAQEEKYL